MNGYLKVQFRKLRCFVANLNIDRFTRFCANFLGEKRRLCYALRFFQVCHLPDRQGEKWREQILHSDCDIVRTQKKHHFKTTQSKISDKFLENLGWR